MVTFFVTEIDSRRVRAEQIIAGIKNPKKPDGDTIQRLRILSDDLSRPLWQLSLVDNKYEAYPAVISGVVAMILIYGIIRPEEGEIKKFKSDYIDGYLTRATAADNQDSLETARNAAATLAIQTKNNINSLCEKDYTGNLTYEPAGWDRVFSAPDASISRVEVPPREHHHPARHQALYVHVGGSVDAGFTFGARWHEGSGEPERLPWFPGARHFLWQSGDAIGEIQMVLAGMTGGYQAIVQREQDLNRLLKY